MVTVEFLGPIGKESITLEVASLKELAQQLQKDEKVAKWLDKCAVAINDEMVQSDDAPLKAGDKVSLLPPVCGG